VARDLTAMETLDCAQRLLEYYRINAKSHERTARFMERTGMETLKSEVLSFLPYIPVEMGDMR
jgi:NAD(P)H-nitrite reductase large subunit